MRKFFIAIVALAIVPLALAAQSGGVGIIDAAGQAGIKIECPVGAVNCAASGEAENYSTESTQNFVLKIVGNVLNFAAIIAVVMLVISAIRLVTAAGSQDGLTAAKKQIMWTLGGLAVIILALLIVQNVTKIVFKATEETSTPITTTTPSSDSAAAVPTAKPDSLEVSPDSERADYLPEEAEE